ncbi:hypothetical protein F2Q69_00041089 [Brassica cretica]|uniref:Uncharacterized protein n=1 Tax=Brassica cretica TaxID=69181 RepID=A0A8S9NGI9_BRACR|nr:hypothetical protein F2Q69_00041089 [Brassica cretica]
MTMRRREALSSKVIGMTVRPPDDSIALAVRQALKTIIPSVASGTEKTSWRHPASDVFAMVIGVDSRSFPLVAAFMKRTRLFSIKKGVAR